jgi:hypothetical protein
MMFGKTIHVVKSDIVDLVVPIPSLSVLLYFHGKLLKELLGSHDYIALIVG